MFLFKDSDDDEPLEKRLDGINLDDADQVWHHLTEEERNEFQKFVKSVKVQEVVPEWTPWWDQKPESPKLVEEIETSPSALESPKNESRKKFHEFQPDILENIPPMSSLTVILPKSSTILMFSILNCRYFFNFRESNPMIT